MKKYTGRFREIHVFEGNTCFSEESASLIAKTVERILAEKDTCALALAGGSTPRQVYRALASLTGRNIDWTRVHFFWGDERCVPPDHKDSNYKMAVESLLGPLTVPQKNIHRIPGENKAEEAATAYERSLKEFFGGKTAFPSFDLILLGLGEDGHTASLFPGTPALQEKTRWAAGVCPPGAETSRVTLTFPVINNARNVIFLVSGPAKAGVTGRLYEKSDISMPAAQINPSSGNLILLTDETAGKHIRCR